MFHDVHKEINTTLAIVLTVLSVLCMFKDITNYVTLIAGTSIFLIRYLNRRYSLGLKEFHLSLLFVTFFLQFFGNCFLELYSYWMYYDKMLHFINPAILALIFQDTKLIESKIITIFFVLGIVSFFEITEFLSDITFGTHYQGVGLPGNFAIDRITDTMQDLIAGLVGIFAGLGIAKLKSSLKN